MIDFGHRVYLMAVERENLEAIRYWRNNPELRKWFRQNTDLSEIENLRYWDKVWASQEHKFFEVHLPNDGPIVGEFIGVGGLTYIDRHNSRAEFSLWLMPQYQSKGFGTSALKTLFDHGFDDLNLHLIYGETFDGNPALDLFVKKLGMRYDGVRQQFYFRDGKYIDAHMISLIRDKRPWRY